jgi:cytochrome c
VSAPDLYLSRLRNVASVAVAALALIFLFAFVSCDSRVREIRSRLSDAELLVFDRGQKLSSPCWACHDFYGTQNKVGPHLSSLYGRRAGDSTFPGYSDALRQSQILWDDNTLGRFLLNPQGFVPGSTMVSPGVGSRGDLEAIVFYIKQVTR